ncbi:hypothetical protein FB451DRAFT_1491092 [Mycena latifolia]|nr:hypothetical protein FB451DRAFT_1491092 [Mycena latifolia]
MRTSSLWLMSRRPSGIFQGTPARHQIAPIFMSGDFTDIQKYGLSMVLPIACFCRSIEALHWTFANGTIALKNEIKTFISLAHIFPRIPSVYLDFRPLPVLHRTEWRLVKELVAALTDARKRDVVVLRTDGSHLVVPSSIRKRQRLRLPWRWRASAALQTHRATHSILGTPRSAIRHSWWIDRLYLPSDWTAEAVPAFDYRHSPGNNRLGHITASPSCLMVLIDHPTHYLGSLALDLQHYFNGQAYAGVLSRIAPHSRARDLCIIIKNKFPWRSADTAGLAERPETALCFVTSLTLGFDPSETEPVGALADSCDELQAWLDLFPALSDITLLGIPIAAWHVLKRRTLKGMHMSWEDIRTASANIGKEQLGPLSQL